MVDHVVKVCLLPFSQYVDGLIIIIQTWIYLFLYYSYWISLSARCPRVRRKSQASQTAARVIVVANDGIDGPAIITQQASECCMERNLRCVSNVVQDRQRFEPKATPVDLLCEHVDWSSQPCRSRQHVRVQTLYALWFKAVSLHGSFAVFIKTRRFNW